MSLLPAHVAATSAPARRDQLSSTRELLPHFWVCLVLADHELFRPCSLPRPCARRAYQLSHFRIPCHLRILSIRDHHIAPPVQPISPPYLMLRFETGHHFPFPMQLRISTIRHEHSVVVMMLPRPSGLFDTCFAHVSTSAGPLPNQALMVPPV
ncbi:uncharacterized protein BDZ83DRAFT_650966 [Colletotrichum acutatum]|uniref:Uncharacterized protein n=1 Tax=Glomerella acutata TaxID=27357 RepID=A0AAD8ULA8_GLOAC|nr:uncharacterized protein BDZ83DRAFT_650966 [Colletotrichum acutatum]KAK1725946.1 hypothetical protein BDZ83DRAFT_650966 [Colletotrichum acutatum]